MSPEFRITTFHSSSAMAVVWEHVDPEGATFLYEQLPALGGGFALGSRNASTPASGNGRCESGAELDTVNATSAVIVVSRD